jgi:hypothetical protein
LAFGELSDQVNGPNAMVETWMNSTVSERTEVKFQKLM